MKIIIHLYWVKIFRWNLNSRSCLCWNTKKFTFTVLEEIKVYPDLSLKQSTSAKPSHHSTHFSTLQFICTLATWINFQLSPSPLFNLFVEVKTAEKYTNLKYIVQWITTKKCIFQLILLNRILKLRPRNAICLVFVRVAMKTSEVTCAISLLQCQVQNRHSVRDGYFTDIF